MATTRPGGRTLRERSTSLVRRLAAGGRFPVRKLRFTGLRYANRVPQAAAGGVNLVGFAFGESGIGEHLRLTARALAEAGIPRTVYDYGKTLHRQDDRSLAGDVDPSCPHAVNLFCLNNDGVLDLWESERWLFDGRYNIGYGFWELEDYPTAWLFAMNVLDEIWAPSVHVQQSIAAKASVPVVHMSTAVDAAGPRLPSRRDFDLDEGRFLVLASFDFSSRIERKNPMAVVEAFRCAFPPERRDVELVFKTKYIAEVERQVEDVRTLTELVRGDPRMRLITETYPKEKVLDLIACCDVYISLHRAEGFGLGMAEAMALGKPVVATAYSGNLDFMTPRNSCLVDYRRVEAPVGASYNEEASVWAEADARQAAAYLLRLAEDPAFAADLGERARRDLVSGHGPQATGARYRRRLELIGMLE